MCGVPRDVVEFLKTQENIPGIEDFTEPIEPGWQLKLDSDTWQKVIGQDDQCVYPWQELQRDDYAAMGKFSQVQSQAPPSWMIPGKDFCPFDKNKKPWPRHSYIPPSDEPILGRELAGREKPLRAIRSSTLDLRSATAEAEDAGVDEDETMEARQILDIEEGKKEARKGLETPVQSRSVRMLEDALEEAEHCGLTPTETEKARRILAEEQLKEAPISSFIYSIFACCCSRQKEALLTRP